jgi:hypothetical protein
MKRRRRGKALFVLETEKARLHRSNGSAPDAVNVACYEALVNHLDVLRPKPGRPVPRDPSLPIIPVALIPDPPKVSWFDRVRDYLADHATLLKTHRLE